jgi:hypothetical protein
MQKEMIRTSQDGKISQDMNAKETALVIYHDFALHQSTTVKGFEILKGDIFQKGELVISEMEAIDRRTNVTRVSRIGKNGEPHMSRKTRVKENVIGKFINQKAFKYKWDTRDGKKILSIWRVQ